MSKIVPIQYFPGYFISDNGEVFSNRRYYNKDIGIHPIKQYMYKGYMKTTLSQNKKRIHIHIHTLVALHFVPNHNNKPEVNHIDGIRHHNGHKNLEWCMRKENCLHARDIKLKPTIVCKINMKIANQIRDMYKTGKYTQAELGRQFKLSFQSIGYIVRNKTWVTS